MEKLADVLKIFLEKHLIPSIISIACSILALILLPDNNWIMVRIGKFSVSILIFCISFLSIQFILKIANGIRRGFGNVSLYKYNMKQTDKKIKETIDYVNEFVDGLTIEDKDILITFIKNGNKILINFENNSFSNHYSLLNNSDIMNIANYNGDISHIDTTRYWITSDLQRTINQGMRPLGVLKQYKLKDKTFHDFEYIYKTTGKLGNF